MNNYRGLKIKEEPEEDEEESSENISNSEDDDNKSNKKNEDSGNDSSDLDIDEDRLTLVQVREFLKKKRLKTEKKSLFPKKQNPVQNITYDSKSKSLRDCFNPNVSELQDFLSKCVVKEILDDDSPSSKDKNQNLFDPQEFMKSNNISKMSLSIEDLSLMKNKIKKENEKLKEDLIIEQENLNNNMNIISPKVIKNDSFQRAKNIVAHEDYLKIRKIMGQNMLTLEQKMWLSEFLKKISEIPIQDIISKERDKFEIVFDLDNTLVFSYVCKSLNEARNNQISYPQKNIKLFQFEHENTYLFSNLIIRNGLKEFLEYIKDLANFHISTLSIRNYAEQITSLLEKICNVKFEKMSSRIDTKKDRKYIRELNSKDKQKMTEDNTIIFDDSVYVWEKESFNVIVSKKFFDKELKMDRNLNNNELENFLKSYPGYSYNKIKNIKEPSWKNQSIVTINYCPFYLYKSKDNLNYNESYFAEYLNSPKYQFIYMKNVIKILYYLVFNGFLNIPEAIKLVRLNALNGKIFYLKYLNDEQKKILSDLISVCGGERYEPPKKGGEGTINNTQKIFLVVSKREYESKKEEIMEDLGNNKNFEMINEKFILDSYYFMTDLGDSYKDKEYSNFDY